MAVVTTKSSQITARDTVPMLPEDARLSNSGIRGAFGVIAAVSGDSIASKYIAFAIPRKAIMRSLMITNPTTGTTATGDVGLYRTTKNGGAVVDADFFKAAQDLHTANAKVDVLRGNILTVALAETPIGSQVGPLSFPNDDTFDVVLTLAAAEDGSGAILVEASWTEG